MLIELATAIRVRRLALGISQELFSERLGISVAAFRAMEQGEQDPDLGLLYFTADQLGWTPATLMKKAFRLCNALPARQFKMQRAIHVRRQFNDLEQQHQRLLSQLERLKQQTEAISTSWNLICHARHQPPPESDSKHREKLQGQETAITERIVQLSRAKKALDEQERFFLRHAAHPLKVLH